MSEHSVAPSNTVQVKLEVVSTATYTQHFWRQKFAAVGTRLWNCLPSRTKNMRHLHFSRVASNLIWHSAARHTFHQDWARKACLPMLSSICLELDTFTRHQLRLSDDLQIGWKLVSCSVSL